MKFTPGIMAASKTSLSAAMAMLASETDGFAISAHTDSLAIKDTTTPANNYDGPINGKLTNGGTSTKWIVNSIGAFEQVAVGDIAIDYSLGTGRTLFEEARTNFYLHSGSPSNAYWNKSATTIGATNSMVGLTGTLIRADTSSTGLHMLYNGGAILDSTSVPHVTWAIVKAGGYNYAALIGHSGGGTDETGALFDLTDGSFVKTFGRTTPNTPAGYGSVALDNGCYLIWITQNQAAGFHGLVVVDSSTRDASTGWSGDGVSGVYVAHMQCEAGTLPTSMIPTSGTVVTRAEDVPQVPTASLPFSTSAGTFYDKCSMAFDAGINSIYNVGSVLIWASVNNALSLYDGASGHGIILSGGATWDGSAMLETRFAYNTSTVVLQHGATLTPATIALAWGTTTNLKFATRNSGEISIVAMEEFAYVPRRVSDGDLPTWIT